MLLQAGLGCKKIKLLEVDTEEDVLNKLTSDAKDEFGNTLGFPQLRTCGGFEMLQCLANCRDLSVIVTSWSVHDLKSALGGQAKIYFRPIQKNLSTRFQEPKRSESLLKEKCRWCQKPFLFSELRDSMVAATQPANYVTSPSIQATNQQLGGEAVDDARRSISNLEDILEQVAIKSVDSGNPVQMLQCLQDCCCWKGFGNCKCFRTFGGRCQLYSCQQVQSAGNSL